MKSAEILKIPPFEELRKSYKFKVHPDKVVCHYKPKATALAIAYIDYPDAVDLFDVLDAYANHSSPLAMRLPNVIVDDSLTEWLASHKYEFIHDKLFIYKQADVPESDESGTTST